MATSFSGGRSRSTRREPPTMGKQLVSFITCGCESSAPVLQFTKPGANPRRICDRLVCVVRQSNYLTHWATRDPYIVCMTSRYVLPFIHFLCLRCLYCRVSPALQWYDVITNSSAEKISCNVAPFFYHHSVVIQHLVSDRLPVPSQGHYGFHSFPVVDWFCLFIYLWVLTFPL